MKYAWLLVFTIFLTACGSGKKFVYKDAYVFSTVKRTSSPQKNPPSQSKLTSDINNSSLDESILSVQEIKELKIQELKTAKLEQERRFQNSARTVGDGQINPITENLPKTTAGKKLTREEKKTARKEIKAKIKDYKKEVRKVKKESRSKEMTPNLRLGLIIGGIGLILAILGSGSFLGTLGGLMVIVGLVLIVIDLIKYY